MPVTKITTHEADAKARLPEQFKNKQVINAIVGAIGLEMQALEDAIFPMFDLLDISIMIGAQLDGIGDILTEPRGGATDVNYRLALLDKAARITASGTPEQVIERIITLTSPTGAVDYREDFPAGYSIFSDGSQPTGLLTTMIGASPTGVFVGLLDLLALDDAVASYELSGSTYDGDDMELTGGTHDGETFDVGSGVSGLFLLEDGDTFYVTYESSGR